MSVKDAEKQFQVSGADEEMDIDDPDNPMLKVKVSKDNFIALGSRGLRDIYDCTKKLGKGGYGKVFQVRNKNTNKLYACKKLSKLNIKNLSKFQNEIEVLMKMDVVL